jgi:hypothetical protein
MTKIMGVFGTMEKKVMAGMMAFTVAAGVIAGAAQVDAASFKDISNHWAKTEITKAISDGYVKGYQDASFKPNGVVTRAEFASIITRATKSKVDGQGDVFYDVTAKHWAHDAITQAVAKGFVNAASYGDNFHPNEAMTRAEVAQWLVNGLKANGAGYENVDADLANTIVPVAENFKGGLSSRDKVNAGILIGTGVMNGDQNGNFNAQGNVTRAEMVSMLYRYMAAEGKEASSFQALNELREVGTTGTNMVTLAGATWGKSGATGKELSIANIIGKEMNAENYSGKLSLQHYIVIDTYNAKPTSVYAKMFPKYPIQTAYTAWSNVQYTANKDLVTSNTFTNSAANITGRTSKDLTLPKLYGYIAVPARYGGNDSPYEKTSDLFKAGVKRDVWSPVLLDKNRAVVAGVTSTSAIFELSK